MSLLFISYKRSTAAVAPLMDKLKAAKYRLWFDRNEIHLGDPDWQGLIDQGLTLCDGLILNIGLDPVWWRMNKRHIQDKWALSKACELR
jgi:hypothetical protein